MTLVPKSRLLRLKYAMDKRQPPRSVLVVISHYNAWPTDHLVALLDQIESVPAGHPFHVRIVVNQAEAKPCELPSRHAGVEILYRANTGYNIGAWDYGWRQAPRFDEYLFLQEECTIQRAGWLRACVRAVGRRGVGLVGESRVLGGLSWDETASFRSWVVEDPDGINPPEEWARFTRRYLERNQIDPTRSPAHLQALILYARRETLEAIDGFRIDHRKDDAIGCEVAISKCVEAVGLGTIQLRRRPFQYILHPQWTYIREETAGLRWAIHSALQRSAERVLSPQIRQRLRHAVQALTRRTAR